MGRPLARAAAYTWLLVAALGGLAPAAATRLGLWNFAADVVLPPAARVAVAASALAGLLPQVADALGRGAAHLAALVLDEAPARRRRRLALAAAAALSLFLALPCRNQLGDGAFLLWFLPHRRWLLDPNAPGAKFFQIVWNVLLGFDVRHGLDETWALSSALMGAFYVATLPFAARDGLALAALLSMGALQHFFGYIEDYAGLLALLPLYAAAIEAAAAGRAPAARAGLLAGLLFLWSLSAAFLVPPVLYLSSRAWRAGRRGDALFALALVILPWAGFQAVFAAMGHDVVRVFLGMNFFTLPNHAFRPAGALSFGRLVDSAALLLETAAAAPALLLAGVAAPAGRALLRTPGGVALGLLAASSAFCSYAGPASRGPYWEWDVLSISAFPLTLLGARLALAAGERRLAAAAVWVSLARAAVWIGTNAAGGPPLEARPPNLWG